jgi:lipoate--protein ligase
VEQGRITKCSIRGDFFSKREIQDVETQLMGVRMVEEDIKAVLDTFELTEYFGAVTSEELTKLILGE